MGGVRGRGGLVGGCGWEWIGGCGRSVDGRVWWECVVGGCGGRV